MSFCNWPASCYISFFCWFISLKFNEVLKSFRFSSFFQTLLTQSWRICRVIPRVDDRYIELHDCLLLFFVCFFLVSLLNLSDINALVIERYRGHQRPTRILLFRKRWVVLDVRPHYYVPRYNCSTCSLWSSQ